MNSAGETLAKEILQAYPLGYFPMSRDRADKSVEWFRPHLRGVLPLDGFHASSSLRKFLRQSIGAIKIKINQDFEAVMHACAARSDTWISPVIINAFCHLQRQGFAYALTIDIDDQNIGGIYGLSLGRAFFGESMYSKATNGSKIALWALVEWLRTHEVSLLDTQYLTPHLASLGGIELASVDYNIALRSALASHKIEGGLGSWSILRDNFISTGHNPDIIARMIKRR